MSATSTAADGERRVRSRPALPATSPARIGQIVLGLFWMTDGALKLQPFFQHHFVSAVIDPSASGQPGPISDSINWIASVIATHQTTFVTFARLTELSIGLALFVPRTVKPALLLSFGWATGVWVTGEGLGGVLTGTAPDPLLGIIGTAPMYILAGLLVWPRQARPDSAEPGGLLGHRGARVAWAALWFGAAVLWLLPPNNGANMLHDVFAGAPSGAGWLSGLQSSAANAVVGSGRPSRSRSRSRPPRSGSAC